MSASATASTLSSGQNIIPATNHILTVLTQQQCNPTTQPQTSNRRETPLQKSRYHQPAQTCSAGLTHKGAFPLTLLQPCCVCKDEKAARDECMLFSRAPDPQEACKDWVGKYRSCMASYGFNLA